MKTSTKGTLIIVVMLVFLAGLAAVIVLDMRHTRNVLNTDILSTQEYRVVRTDLKSIMMPTSTITAGKTSIQMKPTTVYYTTLSLDGTEYKVKSYDLYKWAQENETVQLDVRFSDGKEYVCFKDSIVTLEQEEQA